MAKFEDALVGSDQVDGHLHSPALALLRLQCRNLEFGHPGFDSTNGIVHGRGAQLSQLAKALPFLGCEVCAEVCNL